MTPEQDPPQPDSATRPASTAPARYTRPFRSIPPDRACSATPRYRRDPRCHSRPRSSQRSRDDYPPRRAVQVPLLRRPPLRTTHPGAGERHAQSPLRFRRGSAAVGLLACTATQPSRHHQAVGSLRPTVSPASFFRLPTTASSSRSIHSTCRRPAAATVRSTSRSRIGRQLVRSSVAARRLDPAVAVELRGHVRQHRPPDRRHRRFRQLREPSLANPPALYDLAPHASGH